MDPWRHSELRMLPTRARPVPFCRHGFLPPPLTSPRLLVECVPRRRLAKYALTTSQSRFWLGGATNTLSASSTCFTVCPSRFLTSTVAISSRLSSVLVSSTCVAPWPSAPRRSLRQRLEPHLPRSGRCPQPEP